jgi:hypothetical protein
LFQLEFSRLAAVSKGTVSKGSKSGSRSDGDHSFSKVMDPSSGEASAERGGGPGDLATARPFHHETKIGRLAGVLAGCFWLQKSTSGARSSRKAMGLAACRRA